VSAAPTSTPRRAPFSHYVLAGAFAAIATIAIALVVGASNPTDFWLAAGIGALCVAYPAVSLGTRIFVSEHTITRDAHGAESVEMLWMRQAAAGAFLDIVVTVIIACIVLVLAGPLVEALPALVAVLLLSAVDVAIRYFVIRRRSLR
jgi:hypothetical protein